GLSATVLVSFTSQSVLVDSQTDMEALALAKKTLVEEEIRARQDFKLVTSLATSTDGTYAKTIQAVSVNGQSKLVTASISWQADAMRIRHIDLTTLITDFEST